MSSIARVHTALGSRGYDIVIGPGAITQIQPTLVQMHESGARNAFVVVDTGVPKRFVDQLSQICTDSGINANIARVTPTESVKTIETYHDLLTKIASTGHTRVDPVIALGGGIVGDLAGFVAASYRRGVPVIQCPTTLLSMVDASVGGKTGFNLHTTREDGTGSLLKNLVGAFWQPVVVLADIDTLDSLDPRQRRSGISECIKHGYISSGFGHDGFLEWMTEHLDAIIGFNPTTMTEFVQRNVAIKSSVVELDEREDTSKASGRMLLNFGHTFGHAIETIEHLSPDPDDSSLAPLHHGEAVALGMLAASRAAQVHSGLDPEISDQLRDLLNRVGLPTTVDGLPSNEELIERMGHDKKATAGSIRVIFPTAHGRCTVVEGVPSDALAAGFDAIRTPR